jgi:transposase InsO family protein
MPQQQPSRSLRNGTDSQTSVKELLVAQDEQVDMRICQVLWYLCSIQGSQASPLWTPMALTNSQPTLGIYRNGLHHRPPYCQNQELNPGCGRSSHHMAHFTPCSISIITEETTQLILDAIVRLHGLPEEIVSDRGPQFASKLWWHLFELLGVDIRLSSAFHPKTNGQIERTNQTLEQYLLCTVNYQRND